MSIDIEQLNEDVDYISKEVEKLDEMVFNHEDLLSSILSALVDEPNLSDDTKVTIQDAYDQIYGKGKYAKKEVKDGK